MVPSYIDCVTVDGEFDPVVGPAHSVSSSG
jgi:hypothetical protein